MNSHDEKHIKRVNRYLGKINGHFDKLVSDISLIVVNQKVANKIFRFRDYKTITKRVSESLKTYQDNLISSINVYSKIEWDFANAKVDDLLKSQVEKVSGKVPSELYADKINQISSEGQNYKAFEAFQAKKHGDFTVSERVWNIGAQAKENLEFAIDIALKDGLSAQELARKIKSNLNNPDALFRRVKDKYGNVVVSQNAQAFHPGRGVYRSANKNAIRLAADVINSSYRECEQQRISVNNDVVGQKINISPSHRVYDMCDELAGNYPKDFVWSKWHVACKCFRTTILKTPEEIVSEIKAGKNLTPDHSKNHVKEMPENFKQWVDDNAVSLARLKRSPEFITKNKGLVKTKEVLILSDNGLDKAISKNRITQDLFMKDGQWLPQRAILHDKIIKDYLDQTMAPAKDTVFMLGGAGANGKSSLTESGKLPHPKNSLVVDPDRIKSMIPEYNKLLQYESKDIKALAANFVHEESSYLAKEIRKKAFANNYATVLDGVNDGSAEKIHKNAQEIRNMTGKKVRADYVSLDTDLSLNLAYARSVKTGRTVPVDRLLADNKEISKQFPNILKNKSFDELYLWDTNENGNPRLILSQINGNIKMYDEGLYKKFLSKANYRATR